LELKMKKTKFNYFLAIDLESDNFEKIKGGNYEDVMLSLKNTLNNLEATTVNKFNKVLDSYDARAIGYGENSFMLLPNKKKDETIIGYVIFSKKEHKNTPLEVLAKIINEDLNIINNELQ